MTSRQFLTWGGVTLLILGILGYLMGDLKPIGAVFSLTATENIIHTVLGIVALLAAYYTPAGIQRGLTIVIGITLIVLAFWGFWPSGQFESSLLVDITRLIVGAVALWAGVKGSKESLRRTADL